MAEPLFDKEPIFPDNPNNVILKQMVILVEGRPDIEIKLDGDTSDLKNHPFTMKEGTKYKLALHFYIQREIITGLRYHSVTSRKGITVDKVSLMVGCYGPKEVPHIYTSEAMEAPKGLIARGSYLLKSKFVDDDRNVHLAWEWSLDIKKDW